MKFFLSSMLFLSLHLSSFGSLIIIYSSSNETVGGTVYVGPASDGSGTITLNWGDGSGNSVEINSSFPMSHVYTSPGTYTLTLTIAGSDDNTDGTYTTTITICNPPAAITGNFTGCTGATTYLSDAVTGGTWSSSNTAVAGIGSTTGLVTSGANKGTTTITYSDGCSSAASITFSVNATPVGLGGNIAVCTGVATQLSDNGSPNGTWSSSNSSVASVSGAGSVVSGTIAHTGTTTITYSDGCAPATTITFSVNATPVAITGNQTLCTGGLTTQLSDNGSPSGTWSSSNTTVAGIVATNGLVTSGANAGTTTISYSDGCGSAAAITFSVNTTPVAINGHQTLCTGLLVGAHLMDGTGSPNGTWSSSNTTVATIDAIAGNVMASNAGTTTITYSDGCAPAATITFSVNATPVAITNNTQMCAGGSTITLTDNGSPNGTWSGGTAGLATVDNNTGVVTPGTTQGTTTFSYADGCGTAAVATATVNTLPAPIGGNAPLCANGSTISLTNTSANGTWSGSVPGVATVNANTGVVRSGLMGGDVVISYTNGCSPAAIVTVVVNPLPTIHTFTGGRAYCAGDTGVHVGLTLSDTGITYQLYNGSTQVGGAIAGTGSAVDFGLYTAVGVYHAIATNNTTLCTNYLSGITISINPLPDTFTVTGGGSYCANGNGVPIGLDNSSTGINYQLYNGGSPVGSAIAGNGSALDFGLQTGVGIYTVIAFDAITLCPQSMAGTATVTVIPLPMVDTVTGGGGYCAGDTGVYVGLNNSTAGTIYQLYRGGSPVGTPDTSTGGALNFGLQTVGGMYTVIATNPVTTCVAMMTGTITVTVNPLPVVYNVTGGGSYCAGGMGVPIGLSGSNDGISYQLYNNGTAAYTALLGSGSALVFVPITDTGTYWVIASDTTTHCVSNMSDSVAVSITPLVAPHVLIGTNDNAGDTVCAGFPITFTAHTLNGGATPGYQWNVDNLNVGASDSTYTYVPNAGDVIAVTMISSAACAMPDTVYDTMKINTEIPLPPSVFINVTPITTIQIGQPDTLTAMATNCGSSPHYQWFVNGIIVPGATNSVYTSNTFVNGDSVTCVVIASGACGGQMTYNSVVITVYPAGIAQVTTGASNVRLFPNPNKGSFTIIGTLGAQNDEEATIEITDMLGQLVYKNKVMPQNGAINAHIQLSATLANGMYLLNLRSGTENTVFHFVVGQ